VREIIKKQIRAELGVVDTFGQPSSDVSTSDTISGTKGISEYRGMLRDSEVSACLNIRLTAMVAGYQITPADDTPEGKLAADLVTEIIERMRGSFLSVLRSQMLREALISGMVIAEPIQRIIDTDRFGYVVGLEALRVCKSDDFADGIQMDTRGNILSFTQNITGVVNTVEPDEVVYYPFRSQPWNPYGESILYSAYDAWKLKEILFRLYGVFSSVNASGIRSAKIPDEHYQRDKVATLTMLREMSEYASVVLPASYDIDLEIPAGTAGTHFINGIRELSNKEIRKAILYDESINAEGQHTGSYASKVVSQKIVYEAMAADGWAYCESIAEQLFRRLLDWNGFAEYPVPRLIPEPLSKRDADVGAVLTSLSQAKQTGLLTTEVSEGTQKQLIQKLLYPTGVDFDISEYNTAQIELNTNIEGTIQRWQERHKTGVYGQTIIAAAAPKGRQRADIRKLKKQALEEEKSAKDNLLDVWKENLPKLMKAINSGLFDRSGKWKSRDFGTVRKAIKDNVTTGGSKLRKVLTDSLMNRWEQGRENAQKLLPVKAEVSTTPVLVTPAAAQQMMSQRVYLALEETYGNIANDIYYSIERALTGGISEREAMSQVQQYLSAEALPAGRAATIVNTNLATAYNSGRMSLFNELSDPFAMKTGGIKGYQFSAVMDDSTTEICQMYDGRFFHVNDPELPEPPLHFNCRSILIPVFSDEEPWGDGQWTSLQESKELAGRLPDNFSGKLAPVRSVPPEMLTMGLPPEQLEALETYMNNTGYDINKYLRGDADKMQFLSEEEARKIVSLMDEAMLSDAGNLSKDTVLYRGGTTKHIDGLNIDWTKVSDDDIAQILNDMKGKIIVDDAFVSTSTSAGVGEDFAAEQMFSRMPISEYNLPHADRMVTMEIRSTSTSNRGLHLEKLYSIDDVDDIYNEFEVLLNRGSQLIVEDAAMGTINWGIGEMGTTDIRPCLKLVVRLVQQ